MRHESINKEANILPDGALIGDYEAVCPQKFFAGKDRRIGAARCF